MGARTGSADLPLHGGRVPPWLGARMARLGRVIAEAIVVEYGRDELLRRLAHPFWFQAFGAVMGMDWHSSGITTSVVGALKRGLGPASHELGVHVCGGRGRHSRRTPDELRAVGESTGLDGAALGHRSRLVAKVDSAAVQDGHELYLHCFVVTDDGRWTVIQQGMNEGQRQARRYHWLSEGVRSFVDSPHAAIEGYRGPAILNMTDARAASSRTRQVELVDQGPDHVVDAWQRITRSQSNGEVLQPTLPHLTMPSHHDVRSDDVSLRRLRASVRAAAERGPRDFAHVLETPGVGPRTVQALSLVAEVVHGAPSRFSDPARFAMAHGGKDGHPFPVPIRVYDETLRVLRDAVDRARLGQDDRLAAMRRLDREARRLENVAERDGDRSSVQGYIAAERRDSAGYGGRTVEGRVSGLGSESGLPV